MILINYLEKFKEAQEIVKSSDYNLYYDTYKNYELGYYGNLLKWLSGDLISNEISSFLDIGCAYGTILYFVNLIKPEIELIGFDFVKNYFNENLGNKYNINFFNLNVETMPLPSQKYNRIFFSEVLEHFNFNPLPTMEKIYNSLSDNGLLYLSTPDSRYYGKLNIRNIPLKNFPLPNKDEPILDQHIFHYNRDNLLWLIEKSGFEIIKDENSELNNYQNFNMVLKKKVK